MANDFAKHADLGTLQSKIQEIVKRVTFSEISGDQPLISSNLLDSIGVVDFIVELEKETGISIDLQQVNERDFNTAEQIARKVHAQIHGTSN